MGMRARVRSGYDCSKLGTPEARIICMALKRTGMILADVGVPWALTGEASPLWETRLGRRFDQFNTDIQSITARDIEVVVPPTGETGTSGMQL